MRRIVLHSTLASRTDVALLRNEQRYHSRTHRQITATRGEILTLLQAFFMFAELQR